MTRYFLSLAYPSEVWADASESDRESMHQAHLDFDRAARERVSIVAGEALASTDTATTLRHVGASPQLTAGPFTESAEVVGGFYLLDADNLDVVVELCDLLPHSYVIEIRPVVRVEGFDHT